MPRQPAKWKEFELLIAEIERKTAPDAIVRHNHCVVGRSGRRRQVDISVSKKVGLHPVFIVIECKHYKRPVGIEKVEAFTTKKLDVGASEGIMISITGFDEGAKAAAKTHGITLLTYREAQETDWRGVFADESWLLMILTRLVPSEVVVRLDDGTEMPIYPDGLVLDLHGNQVGTIEGLFDAIEKKITSSVEVGPFTREVVLDMPVFLQSEGQLKRVEALVVTGVKVAKGYTLNLRLAGGHVLEDTLGQQPVYQELITGGVDWRAAIEAQQGTDLSAEDLKQLDETQGMVRLPPLNLGSLKRYIRVVATQIQ